jgi:ATP-binding cassette subfamily B protein RaxB
MTRADRDLPLQYEPTECGLVAVAGLTKLLGHAVGVSELKERFGVSVRGLRISSLLAILRSYGFSAQAALVRPDALIGLDQPVIALWQKKHYVIVERVTPTHAHIFDPESGWRRLSLRAFSRGLSGAIVEVTGTPGHPPSQHSSLSLATWLRGAFKRRQLVGIFALAAMLQACLLTAPKVASEIVDRAIGRQHQAEIAIAIVAYGAIALLGLFGRSGLQRVTVRVSAMATKRLVAKAARLVLAKPFHYFGRNSPSLLASKVHAIQSARGLALRIASSTAIQACSALAAVALLAWINPALGAVVAGGRVICVVIDQLWSTRIAGAGDERFRALSMHNRTLIETFRSAATVKLNGAERQVLRRIRRYSGTAATAESMYERERQDRADILGAVVWLEQIVTFAIGAYMLTRGAVTPGGFVAINMYRDLCASGFRELLDARMDAVSTGRALNRLEDLGEDLEPVSDEAPHLTAGARLELRNVSFSYSAFDPPVIENFNLVIEPGECVAIVGESGSGKSTLAALITGLYRPTSGEILVDGRPIGGQADVRASRIGTVLQADHLLTASVSENISFFRKLHEAEIRKAADQACMHAFISTLPMGYRSIISDEFGSLSGGQRQRILIARAIAGRPRLLVMDEATSFLDVPTEKTISANIAALSCTRVIFAHREETIRQANRVVALSPDRPATSENAYVAQSYA